MAAVTIFIPKNENNERPKNYGTVTCLPTLCKTITFILGK